MLLCQVRDINRVEGMPWQGATHFHAQLGLPEEGHAIKELVICLILLNLVLRVFGQKGEIISP